MNFPFETNGKLMILGVPILKHFRVSCKSTIQECLLQVIKSVCSGSGSSVTGVSQRSVGAKEMHYVLRVLGPAACRNPELFSELAKEIMRIALPPPSKRGLTFL